MISTVFVTYKESKDVIQGTLEALTAQAKTAGLSLEILSHDNSANNIGMSKAVNILLKQTKGDMILILNPDAEFIKGLDHLATFVRENPRIGAMPSFVKPDGTIQAFGRRLPTVTRILFDFTAWGRLVSRLFPFVDEDYRYLNRHNGRFESIEQPGASALLLSQTIVGELSNGGEFFDERFPVYWNDVDMAKRAAELGIGFAIVPLACVRHIGGHATSSDTEHFRDMLFYSELGMIGYARKWHLPVTVLRLGLFVDAVFITLLKLFITLRTRHLQLSYPKRFLSKFRTSLQ